MKPTVVSSPEGRGRVGVRVRVRGMGRLDSVKPTVVCVSSPEGRAKLRVKVSASLSEIRLGLV